MLAVGVVVVVVVVVGVVVVGVGVVVVGVGVVVVVVVVVVVGVVWINGSTIVCSIEIRSNSLRVHSSLSPDGCRVLN